REGREALRSRVRQELGRVDFKALRAQVRAAQARAAQADPATPPATPPASTAAGAAVPEETRLRIARARDEAARSRARLQLETAAKTLTGGQP
ncbi:MAG: hypothetical protein AAFX50_01835, partial [Acidobacteriota bacterium]